MSELTEGQGKPVEVGSNRLAVFLVGGTLHVIDDVCPHANRPLHDGWLDEEQCVVCPWHGWAFDLNDGRLKGGGPVLLTKYATRVRDHDGRQLVQAELP